MAVATQSPSADPQSIPVPGWERSSPGEDWACIAAEGWNSPGSCTGEVPSRRCPGKDAGLVGGEHGRRAIYRHQSALGSLQNGTISGQKKATYAKRKKTIKEIATITAKATHRPQLDQDVVHRSIPQSST